MLIFLEFFRYLKPLIQKGRVFPPVSFRFSVGDIVGGATNRSSCVCVLVSSGGATYSEARMSNASPCEYKKESDCSGLSIADTITWPPTNSLRKSPLSWTSYPLINPSLELL